MDVPFGDLRRHYQAIRGEVDAAVQRVLESGWYILGREVAAFEEEFAAFCGAGHAVGVASGTEALQLALVALGVGPGDEVVTVANAGIPGTVAILQSGARPVYVDVEESSHNLDPHRLETAISPRTRAIMPVHLFGLPAAMELILACAEQHAIPVVEDCAQAHGACYHGQTVGTLGTLGCFSFYPTKNLGCFGDGGMVITGDAGLAGRLRQLRVYGWENKYVSTLAGGANSRLDEMQAAILRAKLPHLPEWNRARQQRAAWYDQLLSDTPLVLPGGSAPGEGHIYHLYVVRSPRRDALREHLHRQGIGTDVHYPLPSHLQPIYGGLGYRAGDLPVTERLAREVLSLPLYPELTPEEAAAVAAAVRSFSSVGEVP